MLRRLSSLASLALVSLILLTLSSYAFADFIPISASGNVFNDLSGNSLMEPLDPGMSGWTVQLVNGSNTVVGSAVTDASGNYTIPIRTPGSYTLQEVLQAGWIQTYPAPPGTYAITPTSGVNISGEFFGDFQLVSLSGEVYNDLNGNGSQNPGEPGLPGWTVQIWDTLNNVVASTLTDASGNYMFSNLGPGSYTLHEVVPAGWTETQPVNPNYYSFVTTSGVNISGGIFGDQSTAVPEPSTLLLLGSGLAGLAGLAWRKN